MHILETSHEISSFKWKFLNQVLVFFKNFQNFKFLLKFSEKFSMIFHFLIRSHDNLKCEYDKGYYFQLVFDPVKTDSNHRFVTNERHYFF